MGLEPTASAVTGRRCNQLNYTPALSIVTTCEIKELNESDIKVKWDRNGDKPKTKCSTPVFDRNQDLPFPKLAQ